MTEYSDEELYAILSEISYRDNRKEILHDHYGLYDYQIDENLSGENSIVVLTPDNKTVIAYRGTNVHNPSDLVADAHILFGTHHLNWSSRFKEAEDVYQKSTKRYPDREVVVTGHSLGGAQSMKIAKDHGLEGHHFNPGMSVADALLQTKDMLSCTQDYCGKQHIYTTGRDPISLMTLPRFSSIFGRENVIIHHKKNQDFLNHSLTHFLPDEPIRVSRVIEQERKSDPIKFYILQNRMDNFCTLFPRHPTCRRFYRRI